jgi:hypothetical protein
MEKRRKKCKKLRNNEQEIFFFLFGGIGLELRAYCLQGGNCTS